MVLLGRVRSIQVCLLRGESTENPQGTAHRVAEAMEVC